GYAFGNWTSHAYYFADGNGNITYMLDSSQTMAAKYRYDPFGNLFSATGPLAAANLYRFSSKEMNFDTGLNYFVYRFYAPAVQQWINRDPLEEEYDINLYGFAYNNSVCWVDRDGLMPDGYTPPPVGMPPGDVFPTLGDVANVTGKLSNLPNSI